MPEQQFLKRWFYPELFKIYKFENILAYFLFRIMFCLQY